MFKLTALLVLVLFVSSANAEGWYQVDTSVLKRVEVLPDSKIRLQKPWQDTEVIDIIRVSSTSGVWQNTNNITITPPSGQESSYLSIVLTAVTAGKELYVYTASTSGSGGFPASQLQMQ